MVLHTYTRDLVTLVLDENNIVLIFYLRRELRGPYSKKSN